MQLDPLVTEAYERANPILQNCVTPHGFRASGLAAGYPQVWARDNRIIFLGAVATGDATVLKKMLVSLAAANCQGVAADWEFNSLRGDERTERIIEPHLLTFGNGAWYVEAYCRLRQDGRSFRLSRIEHCTAVAQSFTQPLPERQHPGKNYSGGPLCAGNSPLGT